MEKKEVLINTFAALESLYGSEVNEDFIKFIPQVVNDDISVNSYTILPESWVPLKTKINNKEEDSWVISVTDALDVNIDIKDGQLITPVRVIAKDSRPYYIAFNPSDSSLVIIAYSKPETEIFAVIVREYFKRPDYDEIVKARQEEAVAAAKAEEAAVSAMLDKMIREGIESGDVDTLKDLRQ